MKEPVNSIFSFFKFFFCFEEFKIHDHYRNMKKIICFYV